MLGRGQGHVSPAVLPGEGACQRLEAGHTQHVKKRRKRQGEGGQGRGEGFTEHNGAEEGLTRGVTCSDSDLRGCVSRHVEARGGLGTPQETMAIAR